MRGGRYLILSFPEAVAYLTPRTAGSRDWSLEPMLALLARLGHPDRHFHAVHVGGTNGKGSVAAMLAEVLRAAGWRVGLYTSPHLVDVRERMLVDGRPIAPEAFASWTTVLRDEIEAVGASFFEATTAIAWADFAARGVDLAVVEVGLGGRLDATNVLDPLVSAVTVVGREHTEYLGDTLEAIAREKAGIAKPGRPFVVGEPDPGTAAVLAAAGAERGGRVVVVPPDARYGGPLALRGPHQRRNAAVAVVVLESLPDAFRPGPQAVRCGLARARLPGRLEIRGKWILDVAHNPGGIAALGATLDESPPPRPLHALVGILRDKDWLPMLEALRGRVDRLWLTQPPSAPVERRWDPAEAARTVGGGARGEPDFERALAEAQCGAAAVLVTGSFHTVGDVMARLPGFAPHG